MKRTILGCAIVTALAPRYGLAQGTAYAHLDINEVKARINSWGLIGENAATAQPDFEVPVGGGAHPLFAAGPWFAGTDAATQVHLAMIKYESGVDSDFWPGPLKDDGTAAIDASVSDAFDQVWCVSRTDVDLQQAYFTCLATPGCDASALYPGYTVPNSFFGWPTNGPVDYDQHLAPFNDFNANGMYDPESGDSPCIPGDRACYSVFNDKKLHTTSGGLPLGVQVQLMAFAYTGVDPALDHTIFLLYKAENKSTQALQDAYIGLFSDLDLGNYADDLLGSDPARNLFYVCNADNDDESVGGSTGYGPQPPAFGAVVFSGVLADPDGTDQSPDSALFAFNGRFQGDAVVDNERFGLAIAKPMYAGTGTLGEPTLTGQYYAALHGQWNDGSPLTYGGNGYGGSTSARFAFPGGTDPGGVGTGGVPQAAWTEYGSGGIPGERKALASMGPFTWLPGQTQTLLFAYTYARAATGGPTASIVALQARVDSLTAFVDGLGIWDSGEEEWWCGGGSTNSIGGTEDGSELVIYPTPTSGLLHMELPVAAIGGTLRIHDATGRTVLEQRIDGTSPTTDLTGLAAGHYTCEVRGTSLRARARLVKE